MPLFFIAATTTAIMIVKMHVETRIARRTVLVILPRRLRDTTGTRRFMHLLLSRMELLFSRLRPFHVREQAAMKVAMAISVELPLPRSEPS